MAYVNDATSFQTVRSYLNLEDEELIGRRVFSTMAMIYSALVPVNII